ncbi:CRISPR-associated protein Csb1 [Amycolatopsis sulphurea]|uniref:CRISPR-associated protein Csb1 n=1 Tax=Amycolatopsis sulphurea TaxID=76022 RepID=A0A2A9FHX4_9PSEU|nr:type I-U CRISPR-associated RAMP protein Csb1/Cas7u [Amycolatopsis sulphurea]PFG50172.1 CRISPR-associated protein Csb1 [Amycolatopsis sulphurea]
MTTRLAYEADLVPILGSTFQPTGFPDLGAATFTRFEDGQDVPALLVESVQSMANRLEATAWDEPGNQPVPAMNGLPWIRVVRDSTGEFLTSSRLEAHRLASPFVHASTVDGKPVFDLIGERLGLAKDTPLNRSAMAAAIAGLDPFCLIHGVFFAHKAWWGQPKFPRALSSVIEAHHVERADSGGRKSDRVRHQISDDTEGTSEGYGSVPFARTEWTAKHIRASFVLDTELLHSYGLPAPTTDLLETIALWEIRSLLSGGLRLRTACDLDLDGDVRARRNSPPLPALDHLTAKITELVPHCADMLGSGEPLTVHWTGKGKKK